MGRKFDPLDYTEPITKIYFVRHGETKANKLRLFFGQLNWDLNKTGILQARNVAGKLKKAFKSDSKGPDFIISSPLRRTKHTAKIIAKYLKIKKIIFDKNLIEKSEGLWQGRSPWQVRKEDPTNYYKWVESPFKNRPPKGESIVDLKKRVSRFYKSILKKYPGKNIIVVAHSGSIKMFLLLVLGLDVNKFWHIKVETGSISEVHLSKKHCTVWAINRI